jgi:hypothetical protein
LLKQRNLRFRERNSGIEEQRFVDGRIWYRQICQFLSKISDLQLLSLKIHSAILDLMP